MIKQILIRILFRLIDRTMKDYEGIEDHNIQDWLKMQPSHRGFRDYTAKRDFALLKTLGFGQARDHYLITLGQRLEVLHLVQAVDDQRKAAETKERQLKAEAERKKAAEGGEEKDNGTANT